MQVLKVGASNRFRHQLGDVRHRVRLALSNGASTEIKPALGFAFGFHALGDGLPVVDFSLIHGKNETAQCWKLIDASATFSSRDDRHLDQSRQTTESLFEPAQTSVQGAG